MTEYSAIILAGGKSSRMGQKKATLLLQGKTFIDIIIDKLLSLGIKEIMISGYDYNRDDVVYVEDKFQNKGPLAGIHAGLERATNQSVLVLTEDAPLVPEPLIRSLIEQHSKERNPITVVSCGDKVQHFPGIYEKSLTSLCERVLKSEKPTVRSVMESVGYSKVLFGGDESLIRGCNTPEEYQKYVIEI